MRGQGWVRLLLLIPVLHLVSDVVRGAGPVPDPPANLAANAVSASQINLSWTETNTSETGYLVERSLSQLTGFVEIADLPRDSVSYQDLGRAEGTRYYYRVRAYKQDSFSPYSNTADATTPQTVPAAPSGLAASAFSSSRVDLSWTDGSFNEGGFRIERSSTSLGPWTSRGTVAPNVRVFSDTGAAENTTYFYRVVAFNTAGSSFSNVASATTPLSIPIPPSGLAASAVSQTQINLSWSDNSFNEAGFKIERGPSASGPWLQIGTTGPGAVSFSDSGLSSATTYYYRLRSYNSAGDSLFSNVASATTLAPPTATPTRTSTPTPTRTATPGSSPTATRTPTWTRTPTPTPTRTFTSGPPPTLTPTSPSSSVPADPSNLSALAVSSSQINLSWTDNSSNESGFRIERGFDMNGPFGEIAVTGGNVVTYSNGGLQLGTKYVYRVRAFNAFGNSGYSNRDSATTLKGAVPTSTPTSSLPTAVPTATRTPTPSATPTRTPTASAATPTPTRTPTRTPTAPPVTLTPTRTPTAPPAYPDAHADADADTDGSTGDAHADADADTDGSTGDPHSHPDRDSDADAHLYAHGDTDSGDSCPAEQSRCIGDVFELHHHRLDRQFEQRDGFQGRARVCLRGSVDPDWPDHCHRLGRQRTPAFDHLLLPSARLQHGG